jgi:hypothetical protein
MFIASLRDPGSTLNRLSRSLGDGGAGAVRIGTRRRPWIASRTSPRLPEPPVLDTDKQWVARR